MIFYKDTTKNNDYDIRLIPTISYTSVRFLLDNKIRYKNIYSKSHTMCYISKSTSFIFMKNVYTITSRMDKIIINTSFY